MKKFSIIGPSGYIGNRHIKAIESLNGDILACLDVVELDEKKYPSKNFTNSDDFFSSDEFLKTDYCVICSPNYLHCEQIIRSLKLGVNVICEKPVCINKAQLQSISKVLQKSKSTLSSIMQLRLHPVLDQIKKLSDSNAKINAEIQVITPRDKDYLESWKTEKKYSGGIIFNLGIHYFDLLINAFGDPIESVLLYNEKLRAKGLTKFKGLDVSWNFSIDPEDQKPDNIVKRVFRIDNEEIIFSKVENDLHMKL